MEPVEPVEYDFLKFIPEKKFDQYQCLSNWAPTPPLTQQQSTDNN